jgi:hypothetical protein
VKYFGLLGVLLGPLAIQYFFELVRLYRKEFGSGDGPATEATATPPPQPA